VDTSLAALKKYAFRSTLVFWGLAPILLLCLIWWFPDGSSHHSSLLMGAVVLWALTAFIVFCYTNHKLLHEAALSLTCSIFLGVLSIGFTSVGIVGSPFNLPATLSAKGDPLVLPTLPAPTKTLWVAAIDLPPEAQLPGYAQEQQLGLIQSAMESIFLPAGGEFALSPASSRQSRDSLRIFASNPSQPDWTNESGGEGDGREALLEQVVKNLHNNLGERYRAPQFASLSTLDDTPLPAQRTAAAPGITANLASTLCDEIQYHKEKFSRVKAVVFSAWRDLPSSSELQKLSDCLTTDDRVSVLAFCLPNPGNHEGGSCTGSLKTTHLPQDHWQNLDLVAFDKLEATKKLLALAPLYSIAQESLVFHVKYFPQAPFLYPDSPLTLSLGPDERAFFKLRSISAVPVPLELEAAWGGPTPVRLRPVEGEDSWILPPQLSTVALRLARNQEILREREIDMDVVIPRRAGIHRVRVVPVPILTGITMTWLFLLTAMVHLFPIPVAYRIWTHSTSATT
jgi:hypothetical protein